jgi:hypothetical protein
VISVAPTPKISPMSTAVSDWVGDAQTWSEVARNAAEIVALIVAALWAYDRFIRQREKWPRAAIEHEVEHYDLRDGRRLLRVTERISNTGAVLLELAERITRVQQILPIEEESLASLQAGAGFEGMWFLIDQHSSDASMAPRPIEPGETDQFEHDFLIAPNIEVVQIYSYFKNIRYKKRGLGWGMTTLYSFATKDRAISGGRRLPGGSRAREQEDTPTSES